VTQRPPRQAGTALGAPAQAAAQAPQCETLVRVSTSQPLVGLPSQSPKPCAHDATVQRPAVQAATPLGGLQAVRAGAAVGGVAGELDLAAVVGVAVAVGEACVAGEAAGARSAAGLGVGARGAGRVAGAAVHRVGEGVGLAAVARQAVAVGEGGDALAHGAEAVLTRGGGVVSAAAVVAGAAVGDVGDGVDAGPGAARLARGAGALGGAARHAHAAHAEVAGRAVRVGDALDAGAGGGVAAARGGDAAVGGGCPRAGLVVAASHDAGEGRGVAVLARGAAVVGGGAGHAAPRGGVAHGAARPGPRSRCWTYTRWGPCRWARGCPSGRRAGPRRRRGRRGRRRRGRGCRGRAPVSAGPVSFAAPRSVPRSAVSASAGPPTTDEPLQPRANPSARAPHRARRRVCRMAWEGTAIGQRATPAGWRCQGRQRASTVRPSIVRPRCVTLGEWQPDVRGLPRSLPSPPDSPPARPIERRSTRGAPASERRVRSTFGPLRHDIPPRPVTPSPLPLKPAEPCVRQPVWLGSFRSQTR
jgi:hypothetical protein